ncbi:GNAT family N-acetyltransferase [Halorussus salilacus]|uniref:GNAT family N-acetyltransferase n=1 Tax=Halorussus salilacus TaxID=2953750 RepID=UPI00209FAD4F|nr:GNAT family N-acetyltransferase [Halorussus salilacus]USZ67449.1 GNAT family N-acetyltransferase [Halorussus salilacus]
MIRDARPDDRDRLRDLQSHLREPNPPLLDYAIEGPPLVLVTTDGDDPVGYLVAFHDGEAGYVAELVVAPECRREGRARRLLGAAFDRLRESGCSRVRLAVHPENDAARRLYESLGFEEVDREEGFYADGSAGIVLGRETEEGS